MIDYRFFYYQYSEELRKFLPIKFEFNRPYTYIHEHLSKGMRSHAEYDYNYKMFGPCQIEVPYKGVCGIFADEVLSPFYIFQVGSVLLWMFDTYYYYACAIIVMTLISAVAEIIETRRNLLNVRSMAMYECPINVLRPKECQITVEENPQNIEFTSERSSSLVPGDIIEVPSGTKMPCDCVLLSGSAIVNEAMLTGESIPVLKTSLPFNTKFITLMKIRNTLFMQEHK